MMQRLLSPTLLLLILFLLCTTTYGQSLAPAAAPSGATTTSGQSSPPTSSPSGPTDINAILGKAGKFTTFIGLLKSTQMDSQINSELQKKSKPGFTIFAPTDSAFSDLKTGTLNSYTDEQKAALTKFHVLHSFLTISQFQTVSNPLHTEAAANTEEFPLNVIGNGTQVNITTGLVNTTVDSTVYSDGQLAVYETPQVLLAQGILSPQHRHLYLQSLRMLLLRQMILPGRLALLLILLMQHVCAMHQLQYPLEWRYYPYGC
ncbi:hypothetical protein PVL29_010121 [Vitis rotundifolia]|uniref:FAS1 domain-containing protein n=1 Tax=Vitis rotundifolia TaxID=103349 RepID=A0AA39DRF1_VITRO|nr:hypothetical protein PVL29_010121 [Vitis rotundifolia]